MNKFALIGHPLGHSMSPLIHEKLFALSGLDDTSYELIDIAPEDMADSRGLLETLRGLNVTIPHKQAVISLVDELAESAQRYNSVNCRMIAIEVARHGGNITLAVIPQDIKNAQLLMAEILAKCSGASVRIADISALDGSYDLLINATPVGMYPKADACAVSDTIIENSGSVFDVIYNPKETLLMRKARALGKTAVGGASMLVYQAVKAHEIWYGGSFSTEDISKIILDVENAVDSMNK